MKKYLSIIVTTHHRSTLLRRCLSSILIQDFTNYEIILCADEGSADTKKVAADLLRPNDKFLVLPGIKGPAASRNYGLLFAEGDRIIFLDDDDTFDLGYLSLLFKSSLDPQFIYFTNYSAIYETRLGFDVEINERKNYYTGSLEPIDMYKGGIYPINSLIFKSEDAKKFDFDSSLNAYEDLDYILNFYAVSRFKHLDVYGPNVHIPKNTTRNPSEANADSALRGYLSVWLKHPSPNNDIRKYRSDILKAGGLVIPEIFL